FAEATSRTPRTAPFFFKGNTKTDLMPSSLHASEFTRKSASVSLQSSTLPDCRHHPVKPRPGYKRVPTSGTPAPMVARQRTPSSVLRAMAALVVVTLPRACSRISCSAGSAVGAVTDPFLTTLNCNSSRLAWWEPGLAGALSMRGRSFLPGENRDMLILTGPER